MTQTAKHTPETCTDNTCYECWKERGSKTENAYRTNLVEARLGAYSATTILNWR